ncbi:MAG: hypothetical protein ACRDNZ_05695 [Streptosporangiaceae bacterium]
MPSQEGSRSEDQPHRREALDGQRPASIASHARSGHVNRTRGRCATAS